MLFLFLLHNTALNQLLKLPVLVAHYHEHQQWEAHISIFEFLRIHYWEDQKVDKYHDEDRDQQLPYKSMDVQAIQHPFIPLAKSLTLKSTCQPIQTAYPIAKDSFLPDPALDALFRPPQSRIA